MTKCSFLLSRISLSCSQTSCGESSKTDCLFWRSRRPSSKLATISQAFATPSPKVLFNSLTEAFANPTPLNFFRILLDSSTTFTPSLPVRKRIAKSSESESRSGPYFSSFSLGLSTFGKSFIFIFNIQDSLEFSRHPSLEKQGSSAGERRLRQPEQRVCASSNNQKV